MIKFYIKNPEKIIEREKYHYANVATGDVFVEATPTLFIQISILLTILGKVPSSKDFEWNEFVGKADTPYVFIFSFTSSIFTSAFGIARYICKICYAVYVYCVYIV